MTHPLKHHQASEPEISTGTGRRNDTGDPMIDALSGHPGRAP
jgi:hypothetical protein